MSEQDDRDLDPELGTGSDADLAEDGWDESFEMDAPVSVGKPRVARTGQRRRSTDPQTPVPRRVRKLRFADGRICLAAAAILFASLPLCVGLATALGGSPAAMLRAAGMGEASAQSAVTFWLGFLGSLLLAGGAAFALSIWLRRAAARHEETHALLRTVASLDLDEPKGWQAPRLVADPVLAAFTERLLGTYRLQQAKLARFVSLEGELHRLNKSLATNAREDLDGQWDNAAVGSVAGEALRIIDESARLRDDAQARQKLASDHGPDLVSQLVEARGWTGAAVEQVNAHGAAVERLAVKLGRVAESADPGKSRTRQDQVLAAIRQELAETPARIDHQGNLPDLSRLVDRASKLTFQIAMEVTRLGASGDRLLPMTRDLEELTTELRGLTAPASGEDDAERLTRALENVRGRVAELTAAGAERGDAAERNLQVIVVELIPAARQVAAALQQISRGVGGQTQRIDQALHLASTLTGIEVPPTATAELASEPGTGLLVDRFDPFAASRPGEALEVVADPFTSDRSIFNPGSGPGDFSQSVLPGEIHDLAEFDAVPVLDGQDDPSRIYDLAEFDAVAIE